MIAALAAWMVRKGLPSGAARPLAIALLGIAAALLVLGGFRLWIARHDASVIDSHETGVQLEVQQAGRAADANLNDRKAALEEHAAAVREEFDNASNGLPREGLSCRQRLDLCRELRDAGTDTTVIPQCVDVCPGGQAGALDRGTAQR
jgi:hypothetical protein